MITFVTILHIVCCIFLVLVVLLQTGKGAEAGAMFGGGGSATMFGASGAGNLLTKLTTGAAVLFFVTSLTLGYAGLQKRRESVFDSAPLPEPAAEEVPLALDELPPGALLPEVQGTDAAPAGGDDTAAVLPDPVTNAATEPQ